MLVRKKNSTHFQNSTQKYLNIFVVLNMKFPKLTKVAKNYKEYAIELYGQKKILAEFDRFFANRIIKLTKCGVPICMQ